MIATGETPDTLRLLAAVDAGAATSTALVLCGLYTRREHARAALATLERRGLVRRVPAPQRLHDRPGGNRTLRAEVAGAGRRVLDVGRSNGELARAQAAGPRRAPGRAA